MYCVCKVEREKHCPAKNVVNGVLQQLQYYTFPNYFHWTLTSSPTADLNGVRAFADGHLLTVTFQQSFALKLLLSKPWTKAKRRCCKQDLAAKYFELAEQFLALLDDEMDDTGCFRGGSSAVPILDLMGIAVEEHKVKCWKQRKSQDGVVP
jgi:hypothetical protein